MRTKKIKSIETSSNNIENNNEQTNNEQTNNEQYNDIEPSVEESNNCDNSVKIPKKRGRKPKGGKIIKQNVNINTNDQIKQNVILHLKCSLSEVIENIFSLGVTYDPNIVGNVDGYSFDSKDLNYDYIKTNDKQDNHINELTKSNVTNSTVSNSTVSNSTVSLNSFSNNQEESNHLSNGNCNDSNQVKDIWKKLSELENLLHNNDVSDKKSACFWDSCDFDNPPIYIPKYELNGVYYVYGCFCSPECAAAYLMQENIDNASKFERYHLLNHIYCKIYNS
jgi:hypothetical protein